MSVQSKIDANVKTAAGRYLHSFVISGESGAADVPEGVHIRFYNCNVSSLNLQGKNGIFFESGKCGPITAVGASRVAARGTQFSGNSTFTDSDAELFACQNTGIWKLLQKSFARPDDTKFSGSAIAFDVQGGSQVRATRCQFSGHGTAAFKVSGKSYALLSKCTKVQGVSAALWALDESLIEAVECDLVEGTGDAALRAETSSRIEAHNCATVKGAQVAGRGFTKSFFLLNKCQNILGQGSSAFVLDSGARADVRSYQTLKGQGDSAVKCLSQNYVYLSNGQLLQSDAKDAIELLGGSQAEVVLVQSVKGVGRHGASVSGLSRLSLLRCPSVTGQAGHGILASDSSRVSLGLVDSLIGQAGNGIKASKSTKVDIHTCSLIKGNSGDGISVDESCRLLLKGEGTVLGQAGHGIRASSGTSIVLHGATLVKGVSGDGIYATADCRVQVLSPGDVVGQGGCGIRMTAGGFLKVVGIGSAVGQAEMGIRVEQARVELVDVASVSGQGGPGISLYQTSGKVTRCASISGVNIGIEADGRGPAQDTIEIIDCPDVSGADIGVSLTQVRTIMKGNTASGAQALSVTNSHLDTEKDTFTGDVSLVDSVLVIRGSTASGAVTWTRVAILDLKGNHGASLAIDSAGVLMAVTTLPDASATASGLVGAKAALGATDLDGGGAVLSGGAGNLSGNGAAVSLNAGTPQDGVDYVALNAGVVKAQDQDTAFFQASSDEAKVSSPDGSTITVTGDIAEQAAAAYSAIAGTTAALEGPTSVDITSGGVITLDGSLVDVP